MRKWGNWKHLSSKKVITVLFLNLVVLSAIVFGFGIWLNHSRALFLKDSVIGALTYRELALCFIFAGIINNVIDYYTIIAPMWNLEEKIQKHEETVRSEDFPYNSANSGLSIETALQELLNQQKLMYDKKGSRKNSVERPSFMPCRRRLTLIFYIMHWTLSGVMRCCTIWRRFQI